MSRLNKVWKKISFDHVNSRKAEQRKFEFSTCAAMVYHFENRNFFLSSTVYLGFNDTKTGPECFASATVKKCDSRFCPRSLALLFCSPHSPQESARKGVFSNIFNFFFFIRESLTNGCWRINLFGEGEKACRLFLFPHIICWIKVNLSNASSPQLMNFFYSQRF